MKNCDFRVDRKEKNWLVVFQKMNLLLFLFLFFLSCHCLFAEEKDAQEKLSRRATSDQVVPPAEEKRQNLTVLSIEIQGNQVISTNTILNKVAIRQSVQLSQDMVNEDIKRLYATGFFRDIRFDVQPETNGIRMIIVVDEKPIVRQIVIEGNQALDQQKLRKEIKVLEGQILDEQLVVEGVRNIEKKYLDKGFRSAKVSYRIDMNEALKEATVFIQIEEGESYRIKKVRFEGAQSFPQRTLRKLMKTKSRNLWFFRRGILKENVFKDDLERISIFYQDEGFLDVKAASDSEFDEKSKKIILTVQVEEGSRYQAGEVRVEGNKVFPESDVWERLKMLPGTTYSQRNTALDVEAVRKFYFAKGYADIRISPNVSHNQETGRMDVVYHIEEGDLFFVDKVKIRGNTKTKDIVIRRELRIYPGGKMDGDLLDKSKERLTNLGFFEEVTYDTEPGSAPNRKDIVFRVKEKQTGELSFGGGYSSVDQFVGFAEISQKNFDLTNWPRFTGGGQYLALRGRIGSISRNVEFSFVEPYLFGRRISFGLTAYNTRYESRNVDFAHERMGAGVTFSRMINDLLKIGTGYTLERVKVFDVEETAAQIVRESEGKNLLSRLKLFISRDSTDNVFNPTKGSVLGLSGELIGTFLGGDEDYYIVQASGTKYWKIWKQCVLEWKNRLAVSDGLSSTDNVPVFDRFFAGGLGTIRGYNFRRVSPKENDRPIGGETLLITNLELTFPFPYLESFKGAFFIDAGEVNMDSYDFFDTGEFIVSVGPGVKINTPIGPVAFYYGLPILNRDTEDANGRFEFSLSRSF
ncbi:MAG: outer membrane protein assembly factor BamA [Candidatus Omnitrophica bacterium]|nr:outer membrane protein assembly factor BamA [Candidatus Omnitrophota bacterium]